MRDIYIKSKAGLLPIGRRGENLATRVIYPGVPEEGQAVTVYVMRNGDTVAYPASQVEVTDTEIIWTVTSIDTGKSGRGKVQYRFSDSVTGEIIKTDIYAFMVGLAIDTEVGPAPDPYETWLDSLTDLAGQTQVAAREAGAEATRAAESAESASESAQNAEQSASSAGTYATNAQTSATTAAQKAAQAAESAESAEASATSAESSASQAAESAESASESQTAAEAAEQNAYDHATNAYNFADSARASAISASQSAMAAGQSATEAHTSENNAGQSATAASASATSASQSAQTATAKASESAASATTAATKASEASASATAAQEARTAAQEAQAGAESAAQTAQAGADAVGLLKEQIYNSYPNVEAEAGPIVSISDGADGIPVKSLVVGIDPAQDLHGYDNPWPAGGGVNLLDPSTVTLHSSTVYGFTLAWDSTTGALTLSGTFTGTGTTASFRAIHVPSAIRAYNVVGFSASSNFNRLRWQVDEDVIVCELRNMVTNNAYNITVYPVVYEGDSTPTAYSPYSNICPISGWTGAKVQRTGKNLLPFGDLFEEGWTNTLNGITATYSNGRMKVTGTNTSSGWANIVFYRDAWVRNPYHFGAGTYIMSDRLVIVTSIDGGSYANKATGFTVQESMLVRGFYISVNPGYTVDWDIPLMFVCGSTKPTAYEPYQGETYPITFPTEAGTVYGGSLDVTNGVLTVDRAMVDLGTLTWNSVGVPTTAGNRFYSSGAPNVKAPEDVSSLQGLVCSEYVEKIPSAYNQAVQGITIYTNKSTQIYDSSRASMTAEEFKAEMSGVTLVYPIATPITYQLTPTEVKTLLGSNNIWADTGDVQEMAYRADTKLYIDGVYEDYQDDLADYADALAALG